jgi:hypothetical protein
MLRHVITSAAPDIENYFKYTETLIEFHVQKSCSISLQVVSVNDEVSLNFKTHFHMHISNNRYLQRKTLLQCNG